MATESVGGGAMPAAPEPSKPKIGKRILDVSGLLSRTIPFPLWVEAADMLNRLSMEVMALEARPAQPPITVEELADVMRKRHKEWYGNEGGEVFDVLARALLSDPALKGRTL